VEIEWAKLGFDCCMSVTDTNLSRADFAGQPASVEGAPFSF